MGRTVANNHEAREVIDDKETVSDIEHNTGRWTITEAQRIKDVNKRVIKELSNGLIMSSEFPILKALGDLSKSSFSRVAGSVTAGSGAKER